MEISTGEALCFGIHLFAGNNNSGCIRLLACVGDEVWLYVIPLELPNDNIEPSETSDGSNDSAILLGRINVGQGYGANVATYTQIYKQGKVLECVAVGCENGSVLLYELMQQQGNQMQFHKVFECQGHTKAICSIHFHPRGSAILSSAKDGTARIFSTENGNQLCVMECEVHDPKGPPPKKVTKDATQVKDPRMMKKPPQILVRGCAYGDLEGKIVYTVASGKRGAAYLSKWNVVPAMDNPNTYQIRQEYRIQCSPVPVSATSLSPDGTLLSLGSVEGTVTLYNLETSRVLKTFQGHDLPVTCLASRPIPNVLMLPGELEGGVNYDVVSASADNRLGRWTLQKKSRVKTPKQTRKREVGAFESLIWSVMRIPLMLFLMVILIAVHDVLDLCGEEVGLNALMMDVNAASHCIYREVLWAESTRAGIRSVPE